MKKINIQNTDKLNEAIRTAEGRATARTITAERIQEALDNILKKWPCAKKYLYGASITLDVNAQEFPAAYRYRPESTIVEMENSHGKWYVTDIYRDTTMSPTQAAIISGLTDDAKKAIVDACIKYSQWDISH